jgi:hypothetical protein
MSLLRPLLCSSETGKPFLGNSVFLLLSAKTTVSGGLCDEAPLARRNGNDAGQVFPW